jgi:hypothetical protein
MAKTVRILFTCVALCLFMPLTGAAQTVARETSTCSACVDCSDETDVRTVRLKFYNQSRMSDADLSTMVALNNRIWQPYGVTIERTTSPDGVSVVVSGRERRPVWNSTETVLGETLFSSHHATPYIRLWLGAADAMAEAAQMGGRPFFALPREERHATLIQMMGVSLAHELAHYLLDTTKHSSRGLLKPSINVEDMQRPDLAHLELTQSQQRLMCTRFFQRDGRQTNDNRPEAHGRCLRPMAVRSRVGVSAWLRGSAR